MHSVSMFGVASGYEGWGGWTYSRPGFTEETARCAHQARLWAVECGGEVSIKFGPLAVFLSNHVSSVAVFLCMGYLGRYALLLLVRREGCTLWLWPFLSNLIIGIKHGLSCINVRQVPWKVLKTEAEGRGFQHLPTDLANVNALKNHVRSLLLHKNWEHLLYFALFLALLCFAFSPMSRECNFRGLCSF